MYNLEVGKEGQVTIFIILAILIVGGVATYFILANPFSEDIPSEMKPVYDYYKTCLEQQAKQGIALLGEQGGYIEVPDFVPGSQYSGFSSHLDFFGQPVPYWVYLSGNNILKEQVPTKFFMEDELENYVGDRLDYCDFSEFELQGFDVRIGEGNVVTKINDYNVELVFTNQLAISFGNDSVVVGSHEINVESKLGKFYGLALDTYNYEKQNMFLEEYALDVMRLYAPVDGTNLTCAPMVFNENKIKQELVDAMSANIGALKLKGSYYDLVNKENNYFVTDIGNDVDESVSFLYSSDWPTKIEIYGDKVIEPVGLQQGMGILGFCYVPYHFVYDINFPVLVQFYDNAEFFQFPIAVVIDKNQARNALPTTAGVTIESEVCEHKNQEIQVWTYDSSLNPVEARLSFKCLNANCEIGETEFVNGEAVFEGGVPVCVNGFIIARADGYDDAKYQISTNEENSANIILSRKYKLEIDAGPMSTLVSFVSDDYSATVMSPEMKTVELIEGAYNVSAYVYRNSSLRFPAISEKKCVSVPKAGVAGMFGAEEERCFDVDIPAQDIQMAIVGGGNSFEYFSESLLEDSTVITISAQMFKTPTSLVELQDNYINIENGIVEVGFI